MLLSPKPGFSRRKTFRGTTPPRDSLTRNKATDVSTVLFSGAVAMLRAVLRVGWVVRRVLEEEEVVRPVPVVGGWGVRLGGIFSNG